MKATLASPALVDGRWYIRTEQHLFAIGVWDRILGIFTIRGLQIHGVGPVRP